MIKVVAGFFVLMVMISAATVYSLKETTKRLEARKLELAAKILKDRNAIKVLRAEMAYLSQPDRLQKLSDRFLALVPSHSDQMVASVNSVAGRDEVRLVSLPVDAFPLLLPQEKPVFQKRRFDRKMHLAAAPAAPVVKAEKIAKAEKAETKVKKASFYERISTKLGGE